MNIIILFFGLILITVASMIILYNKREKITNIEEIDLANDINLVDSYPAKNKIHFKNILDNVNNNNQEILTENQSPLLDSTNKELVLIDDSFVNKNISDYQEKTKDKIQNYSYERIIELSKSGLKTEEIAKITQKGIREVEIILKLQNKKSNSQNTV